MAVILSDSEPIHRAAHATSRFNPDYFILFVEPANLNEHAELSTSREAWIGFGLLLVAVADVEAHYRRALAAGARIAKEPRSGGRAYEAFDPEGHRWRFVDQRLREVPTKA